MRRLIVPALIAALAGCATPTPAERSAQMQKEVDEMILVYGPACEKLGYRPDSDQWRECILKLNASKALETYSTRASTTQCFGHRGFFQCSSF
jgi:hypothetical protein